MICQTRSSSFTSVFYEGFSTRHKFTMVSYRYFVGGSRVASWLISLYSVFILYVFKIVVCLDFYNTFTF